MPSSITHAFFALDIHEKLNRDVQKRIKSLENFKTFAQGSDPLNFYNLSNLLPGKKVRENYPKLIHTTNTKNYFISLVKYIKENKLENNSNALSFLYGSIAHYTLDSIVHPFVIYKTGDFDKKNKNTYKYNGMHADMEVYIDCYMIFQREQVFPKNYKVHNFICNLDNLDDKCIKMLDDVFKSVYDLDKFSKIYLKSIKQMKYIFRIYRYDRFGIKKIGYKFIDFVLNDKYLKKQALSYNVHHKKKIHYLNLERKEWNHPTNQNEVYNYSFVELYRIALDKAIYTINVVNEYLYNNKDEKILEKVFKNLSYKTGKDCDNEDKCKYFEF